MNQLNIYVHEYFQESFELIRSSERANALSMLSLEEKTLIYEYTNWEYLSVNKLLRKNKLENISEFALYLDETLSKIPNYKGIVYRGAELPESVFDTYKKAFSDKMAFTEYGFLSTSQSQIVAQENFEGDFLFEIFSKTGKLIENVAKFGSYSYDNEYEVLFRRNTRFKILDIIKLSKYTFITLKEV
jgi:ADP-ribosyltransferase exoenzyme